MSILKQYFYNISCDCCGAISNDEWWERELKDALEYANDTDWKNLGDKDYCPDCWHWDDDDHIVTADGKVWDEDTEEEIKEE